MTTLDHINGTTFHGRRGNIENAFRYSIDYILIDPEKGIGLPSLFSRNRFNLAALYDSDHGGARGNGNGAAWVREVLSAHNLPLTGRMLLLAQPRILGHVFNPVSFWLCYNDKEELCAVIAEVNNTFGDRHSYLCHHDDLRPISAQDTLQSRKVFHVSPFQDVAGDYTFRFDITEDRVGVWIDYSAAQGGLYATLTGRRQPLSSLGILKACLRRPFGSRRVLALIHWQALKLWWKGAVYRPRPEPPAEDVT